MLFTGLPGIDAFFATCCIEMSALRGAFLVPVIMHDCALQCRILNDLIAELQGGQNC